MSFLKRHTENTGYVHVMFPCVDVTDLDRREAIKEHEGFINVLEKDSDSPVPNKVNVCYHKCSECTCLQRDEYKQPFLIAVHSLYYLNEDDFSWLHRACGETTIHAVVHRPEEGSQIPKDAPEYVWVSPETEPGLFTWRERVQSRMRRVIYGEGLVKFIPLGPAGTIYTHDRMSWLGAGGRHISDVTQALDRATRKWWGPLLMVAFLATYLFLLGLTCMKVVKDTAAYLTYLHDVKTVTALAFQQWGWLRDWPLGTYLFEWYMTMTLAQIEPVRWTRWVLAYPVVVTIGFVFAIFMARWLTTPTGRPGPMTRTTVVVTHKRALADPQRDPIADVLSVRVGPPVELVPQLFGTCRVAPVAFTTLVGMFLLGGDTPVTEARVMAAALRRYDYSTSITQDTVKAALARARQLNCREVETRHGGIGRWLWRKLSYLLHHLRFQLYAWVPLIVLGCSLLLGFGSADPGSVLA